MFGKCKVCQEKEKRIHDLMDQITHLRKMVYPKASPGRLPLVHLEADKVMSVSDEPTEITPSQYAELQELNGHDEVNAEAHRILTGTY
jgi:hypothetical protein